MVAISLYRGNLHRVSDAPRRWPMPPRSLTLDQFRILTRKREEALARIAAQKAPNSNLKKGDEREKTKIKEERKEEGGEEEAKEVKNSEASDPQPVRVEGELDAARDSKASDGNADASEKTPDATAAKGSESATIIAKIEVSSKFDTDKGKRKIELQKKLEVLNQKKHHLVQMLKQILNAEEEIKRRNAQSATLRTSVPLPSETAADTGSATRHVPKLSVEVNFSGDAESDVTANHSAQGRQVQHVHSPSPSAASLTRPFQQNTSIPTARSSLATIGHVQTPSVVLSGNTGAVTSSPSRFAPTGHQGHHHSASLPPVSAQGSHFMASSPSPAASGGSSSVFRDSRLTSSS